MTHLKSFIFAGLIMLLPMLSSSNTNSGEAISKKDLDILADKPIKDKNLTQHLVKKDFDVNMNEGGTNGFPPLIFALLNNNQRAFLGLIKAETDLNIRTAFDYTALMLACKYAYYEMAQKLIYKGANVHLKDSSGNTALHLCVASQAIKHSPDHKMFISFLQITDSLTLGLIPRLFDSNRKSEAQKTIELLLQKGANVNIRNKLGNTPLHHLTAVYRVDLATLKLFLDQEGIELSPINKTRNQNTPLDFVMYFNNPDKRAYNMLVAKGAEPGETPTTAPTEMLKNLWTVDIRRFRY